MKAQARLGRHADSAARPPPASVSFGFPEVFSVLGRGCRVGREQSSVATQDKPPRLFGRKAWEAVGVWNQAKSYWEPSKGHMIHMILVKFAFPQE